MRCNVTSCVFNGGGGWCKTVAVLEPTENIGDDGKPLVTCSSYQLERRKPKGETK